MLDRRSAPLRANTLLLRQQCSSQLIETLRHTCVRHDRSPCVSDKKRSWPGANLMPESLNFPSRFFGSLLIRSVDGPFGNSSNRLRSPSISINVANTRGSGYEYLITTCTRMESDRPRAVSTPLSSSTALSGSLPMQCPARHSVTTPATRPKVDARKTLASICGHTVLWRNMAGAVTMGILASGSSCDRLPVTFKVIRPRSVPSAALGTYEASDAVRQPFRHPPAGTGSTSIVVALMTANQTRERFLALFDFQASPAAATAFPISTLLNDLVA